MRVRRAGRGGRWRGWGAVVMRGAAWGGVLAALTAAAAAGVQPGSAEVALRTGLEALARGAYDDAIETLAPAAATSPEAAVAYVRALMTVGRYEEAEAAAIRLSAAGSAAALSNTLGELAAARGRRAEADDFYRKAVRDGAPDSLLAELHLAVAMHERGAHDSALARFRRFIPLYNAGGAGTSAELAAVATAARYLGVEDPALFRDALRVYDEAIARDPDNDDARALVGELFLEKYNNTEARATFEGALARNGRHPRLLLGLARSQHFDGRPEALESVRRSLEVNPNFVPGRVFAARLHLELEAYDAAVEEVGRALAVNPGSLEALSVLATVRYLQGDRAGFEAARARVNAVNPRYAELYNTLAELSARNRQYGDAVAFATDAVRIDPASWRGWGLLGLNQLRTGAIDEGRASLETSFAGDPYNVWIKNTLDLADTFGEYAVSESAHFRFVVHESESALLVPYLTDVAEEAFDRLSARYGYEPPTPIRLEVYPRHADFSVRTVGLAGMGALGVSFGSVLAMDSPSARDVGDFNWGATLWHEVAHAFHLGMTAHRVPRWFTEGLAVHEERRGKGAWGWGDDVSVSFLLAYLDGRLLPVSELNQGFVRPSYPEHVVHSYYQASLVCEYIEATWGTDALLAMLAGFRDGRTSAEVIRDVLGRDVEAFDGEFDDHLRARFAEPMAALDGARSREPEAGAPPARARNERDFVAQLRAGRGLVEAGRPEEAIPVLQRAKALFPDYAVGDGPRAFLARAYRDQGRLAEAAAELAEATAINGRNYDALTGLADLRAQLGDSAGAADALHRGMFVYPFGVERHQRLAALYEAAGDREGVVRARRAVVALDPVDLTEARYQLAKAYLAAGDLASARREVLRTLEAAPHFAKAQELLLEIRTAGRPDDAGPPPGEDRRS